MTSNDDILLGYLYVSDNPLCALLVMLGFICVTYTGKGLMHDKLLNYTEQESYYT